MVKKVTKKKNRRLRRQIRKTTGCLLLASSIIVAALPVPDVRGADPNTVRERVAVVNYYPSKKITVHKDGAPDTEY